MKSLLLVRSFLLLFTLYAATSCSPFGGLSLVDTNDLKLKVGGSPASFSISNVAIIKDPNNADISDLYVSKNWGPDEKIKSLTANVLAIGDDSNNDIFGNSNPDYSYFLVKRNVSSPSDLPIASLWKTNGTSEGTTKYFDIPGETTQILSIAEQENTILINGVFDFPNILGNSKDDVLVYTKRTGSIQYYSDYLGLTGDGSYYYSSRDLSVGYTSLGVRLIGVFKFTSAGSKINSTLEKLYLFKDGISKEVLIGAGHLSEIQNAYYRYNIKSIGFSGNYVLFQNFTSTSSNSFPDYINISTIDMLSSSPNLSTIKTIPYDINRSIKSEATIDFNLYNANSQDLWNRYDSTLNQINDLSIDDNFYFVGNYKNHTYFYASVNESGIYKIYLKKCDSQYLNCVNILDDFYFASVYLSEKDGVIFYFDNNGVNKILNLETLNIENNTKLGDFIASKSLQYRMGIVKIIGNRILISDRYYRSIVLDADYKEIDDFYHPCSAGNSYDEQINSAIKFNRFNAFSDKKVKIVNIEPNSNCD